MKRVQIYTSFLNGADWAHKVFRDAKTLRDTWNEELMSQPWELCIVHLGYDRPTYDEEQLVDILIDHKKPVLFSESAKWGLPALYSICSEAPVGICIVSGREKPCNLYFALKGWGYHHLEENLPTFSSIDKNIADLEGWVKGFAEEMPSIMTDLAQTGICSESTYLQKKHLLSEKTQITAGNFRFLFYKQDNERDPFAILNICPDWLLNCTLSRINITVRLKNIFNHENVLFVKDLQKYTANDLLRIPNCGRKSLRDLADALLTVFDQYFKNPALLAAEVDAVSLYDHLKKSLTSLPENAQKILTARLGSDGQTPQTLQALGDMFDITRERIRQIEKKHLTSIKERETWDDLIYEKINALRAGRTKPLYLDMLFVEDKWFKGFDGKEVFLKEVITQFSEQNVKVFKFKGRDIVSSINQDDFDNLVKKIKNNISSGLEPTKQETKKIVETECLGYSVPELKEMIWNHISDNLHFATSTNGEEILVGMGRGAEKLVSIILEEAEKPLHFSEFHNRVNAISERAIDIRRVQNCLADKREAKLFDRGTYGLRHHLKIDEETAKELIYQVEEIINNGPYGKQWHVSELIEAFLEDSDITGEINKYGIGILLEDYSENLTYLGRSVWASKHQGSLSNSDDRIHTHDVLVFVLENAGHPLKTNELIKKASQYRGIQTNMQINPTKKLVKVTRRMWGLVHRDLPFSNEEKELYLKALIRHLQRKQKAIHISEINDVLKQYETDCSFHGDAFVFYSLCATDECFKTWPGHLIGLADWSSANRHTITSAFHEVIPTLTTPTSIDVVQQHIENILERPISRIKVSGLLANGPTSYDRNLDKWVYLEHDTELEDES